MLFLKLALSTLKKFRFVLVKSPQTKMKMSHCIYEKLPSFQKTYHSSEMLRFRKKVTVDSNNEM